MLPISVVPIGRVGSPIHEAVDDVWGGVHARILLDEARFTPDSVAGLETFSHIEIVFVFDRVADSEIHAGARHPRGGTDWPRVGIFAQRAKARPNRIGVTICRPVSVEFPNIVVEDLDAIDGTPVLDIKPYMREFAPRGPVRQPAWVSDVMSGYWNPAKA